MFKEACMKKQACVFTVLLGAILVVALGLTGCPTEDSGDSNPFVGSYLGNAGGEGAKDNLVIADTTWNSNDFGSGTYTYTGNAATLSKGGSIFGTASIAGTTLSITIASGQYAGTYLYTQN
jgi:hypothetical protein